MEKVLGVDFDGVLIDVVKNCNVCIDELKPVNGAIDELKKFKENGWKIVIYTCRIKTEEDKKWLREWLDRWQVPYDGINECPWHEELNGLNKLYFDMLIDDKCIRFTGWNGLYNEVIKVRKELDMLRPENRRILSD